MLAALADEPRGTRIVDGLRNLPMLVGLAPIAAYRTLNLPAVEDIGRMARGPRTGPIVAEQTRNAVRATGVGVRVFDPIEVRREQILAGTRPSGEPIVNPALASWIFGRSWVDEQGSWAHQFTIWRPAGQPARAWFLPAAAVKDSSVLDHWDDDPRVVLAAMENARPLPALAVQPEDWTISVAAENPAWVIVSQLADPQWRATWIGLDGQGELIGRILPTFRKGREPGGWQRVGVPGPGAGRSGSSTTPTISPKAWPSRPPHGYAGSWLRS